MTSIESHQRSIVDAPAAGTGRARGSTSWRSIDANVLHSTCRLLETPAHYFEKVTFTGGHQAKLGCFTKSSHHQAPFAPAEQN